MRPQMSWMLGGLLLAGLTVPARGQDKLPAQGQAETAAVSVDDIIRQTVTETNFEAPAGPGYRWEAAAELLFLRPHFDEFSNGGISFFSGPGTDFLNGFDAPEYDLEPAFRLWLAYVTDNGFGVRGRYFRFDADSEPLDVFSSSGQQFTVTSSLGTSLEMDVLDVEGTVQKTWNGWFCLAAAGIRFARLERTSDFSSREDNPNFGVINTARQFESEFEGFGPTFALEGRRRLLGNLSGFLTGRGSVVIGDSQSSFLDEFDFGQGRFVTQEFQTTDNSLWVGELQLGLEWARCFGGSECFLRAALEAQYWLDGGHILEGGGEDSPHDDLTLLGLLLGAGIRR